MGHTIDGFIAGYDDLIEAARAVPSAHVCRLRVGFGFLPIPGGFLDEDDDASRHEEFYRLTMRVEDWALAASRAFALAYVQTDYHGGTGTQSAIVWRDGAVIFGPIRTENERWNNTATLEGAINRALRQLGADRGRARDEFEALGLNSYRDNEAWSNAALSSRGVADSQWKPWWKFW